MMAIALIGSVLNLYVIWKVRPPAQSPIRAVAPEIAQLEKETLERLQIVLSLLTLVLLAAEWITHPLVHRVPLFQ